MIPSTSDRAQSWAGKFGFGQTPPNQVFLHLSEDVQEQTDTEALQKLIPRVDLSMFRTVVLVALYENVFDTAHPGTGRRYVHLLPVSAGEELSLFKGVFYRYHAMSTNDREPSLSQLRFAFLLPSSVEEGQREKGSISSKDGVYYYLSTYSELAAKLSLMKNFQALLLPLIMKRFLLSGDYDYVTGGTHVSSR